MSFLKAILAAGALSVGLVGCGGDSAPHKGELMRPEFLDPADYRAPGVPAMLGDTDPHEWGGTAPARYAVHGIDAARYQGLIDFGKARAAGVQFAWLKATEGGDRVDPGFAPNSRNARAAGVPVGAYHFYYFCRPASEQAEWFIRHVPKRAGDLPPVLDIEWNHTSPSCRKRPPAAEVQREMRTFLDALSAHYGTRPVIYTTIDFWRDNDLEHFAGYELWLRSVTAPPEERYPGTHWTFWQWTGTGVVPGVRGISDVNAFRGNAAAWRDWLARRLQR
jgi:lysozyme